MRYLSSGCTADLVSSRRPQLLFFLSVCLFTFPGGVSAMAQNETGKNDASDARTARMDAMRRRADSLEVWSRGAAATRVNLVDTALLRYSSLAGEPATADGSIWAWGENGRPAALAAIFFETLPTGDVKWSCELLSLSDGPIELRALSGWEWTPVTSKIRFSPIPDAPGVAESEVGRARQMKELARRFSVSESFGEDRTDQLRLMIRALRRYADPEKGLLDGAIYAFANGTNPEALLLLEARQEADGEGARWQFGFARMGAAACQAKLGDHVVWDCPPIDAWDSGEPYYSMFGPDSAVFGAVSILESE